MLYDPQPGRHTTSQAVADRPSAPVVDFTRLSGNSYLLVKLEEKVLDMRKNNALVEPLTFVVDGDAFEITSSTGIAMEELVALFTTH